MRILHVAETVKGGVATYLNTLLRNAPPELSQAIVCPREQEAFLVGGTRFPFRHGPSRPRAALACAWATHRAVKLFKPTILFFHSTFSLPAMVSHRVLGTPARFVYCPHGWAADRYPPGSMKRRIAAAIEGRLCGAADLVANISTWDRMTAEGLGYAGRHVVVENGVPDVPAAVRVTPRKDGDAHLRILFVGRLDRQKGADLLLQAFRKASAQRDDLLLTMIGDSVLGEGFELPRKDTPHVQMLGWIPAHEIPDHLARADVVAVPSRWEGFGLVVAEAYRSGTPVVVSDRGNLPYLVEEGRTGYVVPLDVDRWAGMLASLDRGALEAMRPACRATYLARFHGDRFVTELLEVLRAHPSEPAQSSGHLD